MLKYNNVCIIAKCSHCNSYYLDYKNVRIKLEFQAMVQLLSVAYQYDQIDDYLKKDKPFKIKLGAALLTICPKDYAEFKKVVEDAVLANTELFQIEPQNIFTN